VGGRFAGHEGIESLCFAGGQDRGRQLFKKASVPANSKVENEGADADSDTAAAMETGDDAVRKALKGEAAGWVIGRVNPAVAVPLGL